jgi:bacterial/archaeal transporter family-2 protein
MTAALILILIAIIAGVAVALQGQFMGAMNRITGTATSVLLTYGVGSLLAVAFWLMNRAPLAGVRQIPWYTWSAGGLGIVIVGGIGFAAPRLGLSRTIILAVAAQVITALLVEHFGLFTAAQRSIDVTRLLGVLLTIGGAWLVFRG